MHSSPTNEVMALYNAQWTEWMSCRLNPATTGKEIIWREREEKEEKVNEEESRLSQTDGRSEQQINYS